jgi:hypothetical protein
MPSGNFQYHGRVPTKPKQNEEPFYLTLMITLMRFVLKCTLQASRRRIITTLVMMYSRLSLSEIRMSLHVCSALRACFAGRRVRDAIMSNWTA